MLVSVVSDTHIKTPGKDLPRSAYDWIEQSDAIIHAGDLVTNIILDRLSAYAPVYAVLGNNDRGLTLPVALDLDLEGIRIGVIHDSGPKHNRRKRMKERFPEARIVVFGHSHMPVCSDEEDLLLFNPGSPTDKRRETHFTMGLLRLNHGNFAAEIVNL